MFEIIGKYRVRYRRNVAPGAPNLLMTNAWPLSISCWDSNWRWLQNSFAVVAYDMPGFGMSQGESAIMKPSAQGEFALKVMDYFGIDKVHGVAPDVGVPVMLWLAENHPDRIQSLVITGGPGFYPPHVSLEIKALMRSLVVRGIVAQEGIRFVDLAIRRGYRRFEPPQDILNEYKEFCKDPQKFGLTLEYLASYPEELTQIGDKLEAIQRPVLALWGVKDSFIKSDNGYEMSRRIPNCHFELLPNCGHYAPEDAGKAFVDRLKSWCMDVTERGMASEPKAMV
jgi:pimeloyl-ACP methyl ester carboxylesterase